MAFKATETRLSFVMEVGWLSKDQCSVYRLKAARECFYCHKAFVKGDRIVRKGHGKGRRYYHVSCMDGAMRI